MVRNLDTTVDVAAYAQLCHVIHSFDCTFWISYMCICVDCM